RGCEVGEIGGTAAAQPRPHEAERLDSGVTACGPARGDDQSDVPSRIKRKDVSRDLVRGDQVGRVASEGPRSDCDPTFDGWPFARDDERTPSAVGGVEHRLPRGPDGHEKAKPELAGDIER